jgi:DNA-binding IclR family transcriptional regulator
MVTKSIAGIGLKKEVAAWLLQVPKEKLDTDLDPVVRSSELPYNTAYRDLNGFVEHGLLLQEGKGRSTRCPLK